MNFIKNKGIAILSIGLLFLSTAYAESSSSAVSDSKKARVRTLHDQLETFLDRSKETSIKIDRLLKATEAMYDLEAVRLERSIRRQQEYLQDVVRMRDELKEFNKKMALKKGESSGCED